MDAGTIKKLRIQPDQKILILRAPDNYVSDKSAFPNGVEIDTTPTGVYEYVLLFVNSIAELEEFGPVALRSLAEGGQLWACYPKKSSKVKTDINRDEGWETFINEGFEGVTQISINDIYSGLRFRNRSEIKQYTRKQTIGVKGNSYPKQSKPQVEVVMPDDLKQAIAVDQEANAIFSDFAPSHKRAYIEWVTDAKREETRTRRIEQSIEKIKAGRKGPYA
ncbi:YdeI/OmpD-associated family protein [Fredinandcohnia sp. 179-A 10B2 NHS]|uniref:YdeI/OmpD-associated family protein n=1 Tax=Fredinandcohnia sp. 179-A 10B2 NHS TaxID=3235176 RepID=UPI0039A356B6